MLVLATSVNSMNGCPMTLLAAEGGKELLFLTKLVQWDTVLMQMRIKNMCFEKTA
jgi:hypothetical protein